MRLRSGGKQCSPLRPTVMWNMHDCQVHFPRVRFRDSTQYRTVRGLIRRAFANLINLLFRSGTGIYSYQDPAKADRFSTSCTTSPYRVMIACDVTVEAGLSPVSPVSRFRPSKANFTHLSYRKSGGDPIFVSSPDAIVPAYIIMYHK
jgi:hypothetical protein